jgi:hypothetical protein
MPGNVSAVLTGWAVPAQPISSVDHTYVTSDCGYRWGCHGRDYGGQQLCAGNGNSMIADCLSQPNSHAGIIYAVTGVCHQMANRILHPAGMITVAGCNGWQASVYAWQTYGLGPWPQLIACNGGATVLNRVSPSQGRGGVAFERPSNASVSVSVYHQDIADAYAATTDEEFLRMSELSALVRATLGRSLDKATFNSLAAIQAEFRLSQAELVEKLETHEIASEEYLARLNEALRKAMGASKRLLGPERFRALFGEAGDHPEHLARPDIFFSEQAARH